MTDRLKSYVFVEYSRHKLNSFARQLLARPEIKPIMLD
jgi:hypothetical protein